MFPPPFFILTRLNFYRKINNWGGVCEGKYGVLRTYLQDSHHFGLDKHVTGGSEMEDTISKVTYLDTMSRKS